MNNLNKDGFHIINNVLSQDIITILKSQCELMTSKMTDEERVKYKYQGSNIHLPPGLESTIFLHCPEILKHLKGLGFGDFNCESIYLISKPPRSPSCYWHQDWPYWDDPVSARIFPSQIFIAFYLEDTDIGNGCLRVIPGSHLNRNKLHGQIGYAHSDSTYYAREDSVLFKDTKDAIPIRLKAGDMAVFDTRILHSTYPNDSDETRNGLFLIFYDKNYKRMPWINRIPGVHLGQTSRLWAMYYKLKADMYVLLFRLKRKVWK